MGVPAFYRWLVDKYPKVVKNAIQDNSEIVDATAPNPNGIEFDNLYLDMNGIIHPCFHPDHHLDFQPTTFKEVFNSIFDYVDRLFNIVRPRKLLYLAIDGVAPRAKMNQQRARRFQTAKNNDDAEEEEARLRERYEREGKKLLPKAKSQLQDSNIITPGTEFMFELSKALKDYIRTRLQGNPAWKDIKVVLSDANVPGEGEHKIMSFIRSQRSLCDYDANTRHCLYGLDADLIMLALATHELHFSILREGVFTDIEQPICISTSIQNRDDASTSRGSCDSFSIKNTCPYQFLHIWILREYIELDMKPSDAPEDFKFDSERAVDDFIFMCFFIGNDFLPHMPSLEIHERAIDLIMTVYKREYFKSLGGYLVDTQRANDTDASYVKLKRVERLIAAVGSYEEKIFNKRTELRERRMRRMLRELSASKDGEDFDDDGDVEDTVVNVAPASFHTDSPSAECDNMLENTKQLKEELRTYMKEKSDVFRSGCSDKIKYGTVGWKERYYREKFAAEDHQTIESIRKAVVKEYTEGLCWVLLYYFSGVPSWTWFYPYHYGPCASDLKGLGKVHVRFHKGLPFEPFDQLMAVLPPRSAEALPGACKNLMTDKNSDIASFYPQDFKVDVDGKRYLWQGACILPFIDEMRLLNATRKGKEEIKEYEAERNLVKTDLLFVGASTKFGSKLQSKMEERPSNGDGVDGFVLLNLHSFNSLEEDNRILCADFELPKLTVHIPRVLANVNIPEKTVYESDIMETILWHEHQCSFQGKRVPNQIRHPKTPVNATERLVASSGWIGRGRGVSGTPCSNTKQGVHGRPIGYNYSNGPNCIGNTWLSSRPSPPISRGAGPHWRAAVHATSPVASNYYPTKYPVVNSSFASSHVSYGAPYHIRNSMSTPPGFRMQTGEHNHPYGNPRTIMPAPIFIPGAGNPSYASMLNFDGSYQSSMPASPGLRPGTSNLSYANVLNRDGNYQSPMPAPPGFNTRANNSNSPMYTSPAGMGYGGNIRGELQTSSMVGEMENFSISQPEAQGFYGGSAYTGDYQGTWRTVRGKGRGRSKGQFKPNN